MELGRFIIKLLVYQILPFLLVSCNQIYLSKQFNSEIIIDTNYVNEDKKLIKKIELDSNKITLVKTYDNNNNLISIERYSDYKRHLYFGESMYLFPNGKIELKLNYNEDGDFDGKQKSYYLNGKIKRDDLFKNGELISGQSFDSIGNPIKYIPLDVLPSIDMYLVNKSKVYPEIMRRKNIQESVILYCLIDKKGKIAKIKYDNKNSFEFVKEAIRCTLKYGKYNKPRYIDGKPSECWVYLTIEFILKQ